MNLMQILSLVGIDILLSGDNAVVIALAASSVPKHLQGRAIFGGMLGAIVLRILAAAVLIKFLQYSFVQAIGGLILLRIAYHLIVQKDEEQQDAPVSKRIWSAIRIIAIADFTMSIDNVIALSSVARGILPIFMGIIVSIPIIIIGSRFFMMLMEKFPVIIYVGSGFLAFAAGKMIIEDKGLTFLTNQISDSYNFVIPLVLAIVLLAGGFVKNYIKEVKIFT
ncbi:YjbE family putative metal transport protein [Neobacillus massiliamazoniensis]|uniref:Integral membrane protein TerC n=1 Tax=Neobacillus massiliamazoniensis TaxID=1499688 RepID=A0A0U1NVA4_9BACI|nr:YjbE family putative metal transport protein [Neobacillus massiliamazoniensis]CRK81957.1 integral membrane protein TerC [Neobacillus massiliamazoniensis]